MRNRNQLALPLGQVDPPEHLLRAAWERSELPKSFEESMQLTHFRIGLKRMAMAMANNRRTQ